MERRKGHRPIEFYKHCVRIAPGGGVPSLEINYLFFIFILFMQFSGHLTEYIMTLVAMLFHELGHVVATLLTGGKVFALKILPVGFCMSIDENGHKKCKEIAISLSGPFANILVFAVCIAAQNTRFLPPSDNTRFFIITNMYLAAFNIIPIYPFDGGRVLRQILFERKGLFIGVRRSRTISVLVSSVMIMAGIVQLTGNLYNFSLLAIGLFTLFSSNLNLMEAALMNIKQILYRRSRLLKKGVYPVRDLVAVKSVSIGEAIKNMDFDRFHMVHVLNDDLKVCRVLSEQEIIDAALKYSTDLTFEELIKIT